MCERPVGSVLALWTAVVPGSGGPGKKPCAHPLIPFHEMEVCTNVSSAKKGKKEVWDAFPSAASGQGAFPGKVKGNSLGAPVSGQLGTERGAARYFPLWTGEKKGRGAVCMLSPGAVREQYT